MPYKFNETRRHKISKARAPFLVEEFPLAPVNVALRQAFTAERDSS